MTIDKAVAPSIYLSIVGMCIIIRIVSTRVVADSGVYCVRGTDADNNKLL